MTTVSTTSAKRPKKTIPAPLDILLAHDVSWRPLIGPRPWIVPAWYGPDAAATAQRLGMELSGDRWFISERTPDLAESALCAAGVR